MADRSGRSLRCGLAAATVLAGMLTSVPAAPAAASAPPYVSDPVTLVNDPRADVSSSYVQGETASTVVGGNVVVAWSEPTSYGTRIGWAVSADGGRSFTDRGGLASPDGVSGNVALASDATAGVAYLATAIASRRDIQVFRSADGGRTFGEPAIATPGVRDFTDFASIAVDDGGGRCGGNVYVEFGRFGPGMVPELVVTRSTDGGRTWRPHGGVVLDRSQGTSPPPGTVVVTPDHRVHVFYYGDVPGEGSGLLVRTSSDCGTTFGAARMALPSGPPNYDEPYPPPLFASDPIGPRVAVSRATGAIAVASGGNPLGEDRFDLAVAVSRDGGATWSAPVPVGSDTTGADQLMPSLAFSADGRRLMVSWFDRRNGLGFDWLQRFGQIGTMAGGTVDFAEDFVLGPPFPGVRELSTVSYDAIAATPAGFVPTWTDARDGNAFAPHQPDIRFASVPTRGPTDLSLAVSAPAGPVTQGDVAAVTATITNEGTGPAEVVGLTVRLTGGLRGTALTAPPGGHCGGTRIVTCRLGRVPGGRTVTVSFGLAGVVPGTGTATATLTSATADPDPTDDAAAAEVTTEPGTTAVHDRSEDDVGYLGNFSTVDVPFTFDDPGWVLDADVSVRVRHFYVGDLVVRLVSPEGTVVPLVAHAGDDGDHFGTGELSCAGVPTTFDDSADQPITSGSPPFAGTYRPVRPLADVVGDTLAGTWHVQVSDLAREDTGYVGCVRLRLEATT